MTTQRFRRCGLLLWLALACAAPADEAQPGAQVVVGMHVVSVDVADTVETRAQGLSGRSSLEPGHGMWFPYAVADRYGFWMRDMHFDIDIVWVRSGAIVDITHQARHGVPEPLPVYRPREPADAVLEVPSGTALRLGWQEGDPVRFEGAAAGKTGSGGP